MVDHERLTLIKFGLKLVKNIEHYFQMGVMHVLWSPLPL